MQESISIGRAATMLGVSISTLRRWHSEGRLIPAFRSLGGHRRYSLDQVLALIQPERDPSPRITLAYARVSSHDQKADLDRQANRLAQHCATYQDGPVQVIRDLGSGLNYTKPGFRQLLKLAQDVIELMTVFSARLYGSRSHKNRRALQ